MPTYEYACKSCGRHIEVFQRISDEPLVECPHCAGQLRKVFHPAGILFKGSGFYETDYRSDSYKAAAKKETESSAKSSDTGGTNGTAAQSDTAGKADTAKAAGGKKSSGKSAKSKG